MWVVVCDSSSEGTERRIPGLRTWRPSRLRHLVPSPKLHRVDQHQSICFGAKDCRFSWSVHYFPSVALFDQVSMLVHHQTIHHCQLSSIFLNPNVLPSVQRSDHRPFLGKKIKPSEQAEHFQDPDLVLHTNIETFRRIFHSKKSSYTQKKNPNSLFGGEQLLEFSV